MAYEGELISFYFPFFEKKQWISISSVKGPYQLWDLGFGDFFCFCVLDF